MSLVVSTEREREREREGEKESAPALSHRRTVFGTGQPLSLSPLCALFSSLYPLQPLVCMPGLGTRAYYFSNDLTTLFSWLILCEENF